MRGDRAGDAPPFRASAADAEGASELWDWLWQFDTLEQAADELGVSVVPWDWAGCEAQAPDVLIVPESATVLVIKRGTAEEFTSRACFAITLRAAKELGVHPGFVPMLAFGWWLRTRFVSEQRRRENRRRSAAERRRRRRRRETEVTEFSRVALQMGECRTIAVWTRPDSPPDVRIVKSDAAGKALVQLRFAGLQDLRVLVDAIALARGPASPDSSRQYIDVPSRGDAFRLRVWAENDDRVRSAVCIERRSVDGERIGRTRLAGDELDALERAVRRCVELAVEAPGSESDSESMPD
jgi:hypothetical protein